MKRTGNAEWIPATPAAAARFMASIALALAFSSATAIAAETYQYDAIGRLTDVAYANGGSLHYTYDANGNILSIVTSLATAVDGTSGAPLQFTLGPTTPNPGSGARDLNFTIPSQGHVTLRVFDVAGREVSTLVDRELPAGRQNVRFFTDGWANGVYYYRLALGTRTLKGKLTVLR